jgi:hypothetical protein
VRDDFGDVRIRQFSGHDLGEVMANYSLKIAHFKPRWEGRYFREIRGSFQLLN